MKTKLLAAMAAVLALALGLALAGCSTISARIRGNPEAFYRLTLEQRELVRMGRIDIGFNKDAVRLALGEPTRILFRTDAVGTTEIWRYFSYEAAGRVLFTGIYHAGHNRDFWGWGLTYPFYLDYPDRRVSRRFTVEFTDGLVSAIGGDVEQ